MCLRFLRVCLVLLLEILAHLAEARSLVEEVELAWVLPYAWHFV